MTKEVFGTKEWSDDTVNLYTGCSNGCHYCYAAANAIRWGRATPESWLVPKGPQWTKLDKLCRSRQKKKIMFPSSHDITPGMLADSIEAITRLLDAGHSLLIVSKPRYECIAELINEFDRYRDRILFRFTIGSADDKVLKFWEPNAPSFSERRECLDLAWMNSYETSVSCEPMLDMDIKKVIEMTHTAVTDSIWLGLPNFLIQRLTQSKASTVYIKAGGNLIRDLGHDNYRHIHNLYAKYKDNPKVKWKESIKRLVGIKVPTEVGLDE